MNAPVDRLALRRRPLYTPLYAGIALLAVAVIALGWAAQGLWQTPGTVVVVRHMEKAVDGSNDPSLSPAGQARAERVAEMLAAMGVDAVYATQYKRTAETAMPLATRLSLPLHVYDAGDTDALVGEINDRHRNGVTVVIGHSNTVPAIVKALSRHDIGEIPEDRYGDVYLIVRPQLGRAKVTRLYISGE